MKIFPFIKELIVVGLFCLTTSAFASIPDSIKIKLDQEKDPIKKAELYFSNADDLIGIDDSLCLDLINEGRAYSKKIKFELGEGRADLTLGRYFEEKGNYKRSIELFIRSSEIFEKENDTKGLGQAYNNIGISYWYINQNEKAISYLLKALKINRELRDNDGIASNLANLGILYDESEKKDSAILLYESALSIFIEQGNRFAEAAIYNNLGLIHTDRGEFPKAIEYFDRSLKIREELNDKGSIVASLNNLGYVHVKMGSFSKAIPYLERSLKMAEELSMLYDQRMALLNLANSKAGIGEFKPAFEYFKRYSSVKDSILNKENQELILEMESKYQNELKQRQIEKLEQERELQQLRSIAEKEKERSLRFLLIGAIGIVIVIALFLLWRFNEKKKANLILEEKNKKISEQKEIIEEKNRDITDSIQYAQTIQHSILPPESEIKKQFPDSFVLFLPRDIVSGDFYWVSEHPEKKIFAVADCTGHGVPGALMSMVGNNLLDRIVNEKNITDPGEILNQLSQGIRKILRQEKEEEHANDGMDIAIVCVDENHKTIRYASAQRPIYILKKEELIELPFQKLAVGGQVLSEEEFKSEIAQLESGDLILCFSDGYCDQFGGLDSKKFLARRFKELLLANRSLRSNSLKEKLQEEFLNWKGDHDQLDDVCIMGVSMT